MDVPKYVKAWTPYWKWDKCKVKAFGVFPDGRHFLDIGIILIIDLRNMKDYGYERIPV